MPEGSGGHTPGQAPDRAKGMRLAIPLVLAFAVTLAMAWQIRRLEVRSLAEIKQTVQEQQLANVRNCQQSMAGLVQDCVGRIQRLAGGLVQDPQQVQQLARSVSENPDNFLLALCCWDAQGRPLWSTAPDALGPPADSWATVQEQCQGIGFYSCRWNGPNPDSMPQTSSGPAPARHVLVVVSALDSSNRVQGYLGGVMDVDRILTRTVHPIPSDSNIRMRYWVLDGSGQVLLHLAPPPQSWQSVFPPVVQLTDDDLREAARIAAFGSRMGPYEGAVELGDEGELLAYCSLRLGNEQYLLAVTTPAGTIAQTFHSQRIGITALMVGVVALLVLGWWISRGMEAAQVRLRAQQEYVRQIQRAQEALLASHRRYRDWENNVPIGICRLAVRPRGLVLSANPALAAMLGADQSILVGANLGDYFWNPVGMRRLYHALEQTGSAMSFQTSFRNPHNQRVWALVTSIASRDEQGRIEYYNTLVEDICQRHAAEEALRDSRKRLQAMVQHAPVLLWTTDAQGILTFMQGAPLSTLGWTPEQAVGKAIGSFSENEELGREILHRCMAGETFSFKSRLRDRWFESSAAPMFDDRIHSRVVIGVSIDVTDRDQAQQALDAQRGQMELIFKHSSDGICIRQVDEATYRRRLVMCNDRFVEMSGFGREELLARYGVDKLLVHHNSYLERQHQRDLILNGQPASGVDSWIRPDGKENYHEFTSVPVRSGGGLLIVEMHRDITERLKTEAALKQAHRQLVSAREQERRRLAQELHDSVSQGLVALQLAMRGALAGSATHLDEAAGLQLARAIQQCGRLVGEVRRLCHGLYPPTLESLGLVAALQQLIHSCGDSAAKIELSYDEALAGRRFQGEIEITLFRIAQEAINNAMRHSPGAAIAVSLQTRDDGSLCLWIRDDGAGFDTAASAGGLGLLSMKERALSVGGVLTVSSKPEGTCIQAAVPAREPAPSELATGPEGG